MQSLLQPPHLRRPPQSQLQQQQIQQQQQQMASQQNYLTDVVQSLKVAKSQKVFSIWFHPQKIPSG